MFLDVSPFLLLGFLIAGLIKVFLPEEWVARRLGGRGAGPVLKAALLGVPLPLCSCGVIPAALGLRRQGASRGATLSFMVSTPETGVDSIAVTWAILGPVMAILRPVAAFVSAVICGLASNAFGGRDEGTVSEPAACTSCGAARCGHVHTVGERAKGAIRFAFDDLLRDVAIWLVIGVLLAGVISAFLRPEIVGEHVGSEWAELLLMLVVSIPLYICATASTPVAAALVIAGFSPGAALVLLLAGPATNVATLLMVGRFLGARAAAIYLVSIASTSLLFGWLVNRLAGALPSPITTGAPAEALPRWLMLASAAVLLCLMGRLVLNRLLRRAA